MERKRLATGIGGLDVLLEGGLPEGKTYLVTGDPGGGKSLFCTHFLLKGLEDGERAVYVAIDETPAEIVEQAESLGLPLAQYVDRKALLILDASTHFSSRMGREKEIDVQRVIVDLGSYVKRMEASRIVIDSAGPLILLRDAASRIQDQARRLIFALQTQLKTTNLLTCYPVPRTGEKAEHAVEEYLVAGVIALRLKKTAGGWTRTLAVEKMRATATDLAEHEFAIVKGRGIVLKPV
ncbi:MAG TPA: ATPase domain-containing protein [Candidatus Acidoferrales bacterium]|nr:ATPase domain-containing protein [Candidatus Acidoferrales bacterium]